MEGELENHLDEEERSSGNRKNGKTSKKLKTADGSIDLETHQNRAASFEPQTEFQTCVVHQFRNSIKYVSSKDQKAFMADLKPVYQAVSKDEAEHLLQELEEKWGKNIR